MKSLLALIRSLCSAGQLGAILLLPFLFSAHAQAAESPQEKIDTARDKSVTQTHKTVRKAKKHYRKATDQGSTSQDVKDAAKNVGDDVSDKAKETKRKVVD